MNNLRSTPGFVSCMALMFGLAWHCSYWAQASVVLDQITGNQEGISWPFIGLLSPALGAYLVAAFFGVLAYLDHKRGD